MITFFEHRHDIIVLISSSSYDFCGRYTASLCVAVRRVTFNLQVLSSCCFSQSSGLLRLWWEVWFFRYCSNYYNEQGTSTVCDWCQSEERSGSRTFCWTKLEKKDDGSLSRYVNSSKNHNMENHDKGKNLVASSSSRPANRRYKLLKDVMC